MTLLIRQRLSRILLVILWCVALLGLLLGQWGLLGFLVAVPVSACLGWDGSSAFLANFFAAAGLLGAAVLGRVFFDADDRFLVALSALVFMSVSAFALWKFLQADLSRRHKERQVLGDWDEEKVGLEQALATKANALVLHEHRHKRYARLQEAATLFASTLDLAGLGSVLLSQAAQLLAGRKVDFSLWVFGSEGQELLVKRVDLGGKTTWKSGQLAKDDALNQWVLGRGVALLIRDLEKDFRFKGLELVGAARCFYISPLVNAQGAVTGLVRIESSESEVVDTEDQRLLESLVVLGSSAIENAKLYRETQELAVTDGLTKLYLRRPLLERLDAEVARAFSGNSPFSLLMIDIDHFKSVNDTFGHPAGDKVLRSVASIIKANVRDVDMCGRYGGEEFIVLLPETPKEGSLIVAERIRLAVATQLFDLRGEQRSVTVSVGCASLPGDARDAREMIARADEALYFSKENGRNKVSGWDPSLGEKE